MLLPLGNFIEESADCSSDKEIPRGIEGMKLSTTWRLSSMLL